VLRVRLNWWPGGLATIWGPVPPPSAPAFNRHWWSARNSSRSDAAPGYGYRSSQRVYLAVGRTSPGSRIGQACSQAARRRVPEPSVRNDSLSALRPLTPPASVAQPHHQPLHARLQIDIEVDQRTGSARIDSWSPVSCDAAAAYFSYGQSLHCIALYMASLAT